MSSKTRWRLAVVIAASISAFGWWWFDPFKDTTANLGRNIRALNAAGNLQSAVKNYHAEYGHFPLAEGTPSIPDQKAESKGSLLAGLLGANTDKLNPREIEFLNDLILGRNESALIKVAGEQRLNDPWGRTYRIIMDTDGSFDIENPQLKSASSPAGPRTVATRVLVYSSGADGLEGTSDDMDSWRELIKPRAMWNLEIKLLAFKATLLTLLAGGAVCLSLLVVDALRPRRI